jgi:hypothetical protein
MQMIPFAATVIRSSMMMRLQIILKLMKLTDNIFLLLAETGYQVKLIIGDL